MKKKTKDKGKGLIYSLMAICLALTVAAMPIYASASIKDNVSADVQQTVESAAGNPIGSADEQMTDTSSEVTQPKDDGVNVFTEIFDAASAYSTDILALLNLILGLVITTAYRRGLTPKLKKDSEAIKGAIAELSKRADKGMEADEQRLSSLSDTVTKIEEESERMKHELLEIKECVGSLPKAESEQRLLSVLSTQVDMLYNIFISSALPEYQKEAVTKQLLTMKEELGKNE